jgi:nucleoid-associated protein YgaU
MGLIGKIALIGIVSVAVLIAVIWDMQNEKASSPDGKGKTEDKIAENLPGNLTPQDTPSPASGQEEGDVAPKDGPGGQPEGQPAAGLSPVEKAGPTGQPDETPKEVVDKPEPGTDQPQEKGAQYTIEKGDTLSELARRFYGDPKLRHIIQQANVNAIPDPEVLRVGDQIYIPPRPVAAVKGPAAADLHVSKETYIVQAGDTLSRISRMHYGDNSGVDAIYQANRDRIADKNVLKPGVELIIPPMPKKEDK